MADEKLPPSGTSADGENESERQAANHPGDQSTNDVNSPDGNKIVKLGLLHLLQSIIVAGIFATGVWVLGDHLDKLGYSLPSNVFNLVACVVFFAVLPFELTKHWPRPVIVWSLFFLFIAAPLAFVFLELKPFTSGKTSLEGNSHLALAIETSSDNFLFLTNDSLISTQGSAVAVDNGLYLLVPIQPSETNVELGFFVFNDSKATAYEPEVSVISRKDIGWQYEDNWNTNGAKVANGKKALFFSPAPYLIPTSGASLPKFKFIQSSNNWAGCWEKRFFVSVVLTGKNIPPYMVSFWMELIPAKDQTTSEPYLASGTNLIFWGYPGGKTQGVLEAPK